MANTTATISITWGTGQSVILKGTPVDQYGNLANGSGAYGIVAENLLLPNRSLTVITAGEWDEDEGLATSGIALTDEAKLALSGITFKNPVVVYAKMSDLAKAATTEKAGLVKMAESVADSEEESSPTTAEFNGLLAALRTSGALETPEPETPEA